MNKVIRWLYFKLKKYSENQNKYDSIVNIYSDGKYKNITIPFFRDENNRLIGIECWMRDVITLKKKKKVNYRPLYKDESLYIYYYNKALYQSKEGITQELCSYALDDIMYCDMIYENGFYALRSGGTIRISDNLKNWKLIYQGKRGIKDSMVFVKTEDGLNLLFIDYTPGTARERHHIYSYNIKKGELKVKQVFYTFSENQEKDLSPCARHLHTIAKDPYTGYIYVGTGDNDWESSIFVSKDNGEHFEMYLSGSQQYRALSFFFTEKSVFWNTDTHESQAIYRLDKYSSNVERYPLINGALWCTLKYPHKVEGCDFYMMSSNSEGALFDNYNRVYGILIKDERPLFYELLKKRSRTKYSQQFPLGLGAEDNIILYDHEINKSFSYKLILK